MSALEKIFQRQRSTYQSDVTKSYEWRIDQLNRLKKLLLENQQAINTALGQDFKTSWYEQSMEFYGTLGALEDTIENLKEWMTPEFAKLPTRFVDSGHSAVMYREPYGVSLIITPFNAPVILTFEPLMAALAAGNTAIVKPSESTERLSNLYQELFDKYFNEGAVCLVRGSREVVSELLSFPFDFIFFTGSTRVGKVVMRAAAEHLTPVLLELGGQNPVVVDQTANLMDAADKLVWGMAAFGGQWCVSPGYVYVHEEVATAFVDACKIAIRKLYGRDPKQSPDLSRIISEKDVARLQAMLEGSQVVMGGDCDVQERYFSPTIVYPAKWSDPIMQEEIFGPILPILPYNNLEAVINEIKRHPKSLAAYVFSQEEATVKSFLSKLSFGSGAVNQTMIQCLTSSSLPFGGVGASGLGRYYGKFGFDSLSHLKSVIFSDADTRIEALLPPYDQEKLLELGDWFKAPARD